MYRREDRRSDSKQFEPKPYWQAALWFRRAAAQDYWEAYSNLGFLYEQGMLLVDASGRKVPSLYREAQGLYMRAADPGGLVRLKGEKGVAKLGQNVPGLTVAQYNLGSLFDPDERIAEGLPASAERELRQNKNRTRAEFWYSQAAAKGHAKAQVALAKRMLGRPKLGAVDRVAALKCSSSPPTNPRARRTNCSMSRKPVFQNHESGTGCGRPVFAQPEAGEEAVGAHQKLERLAALAARGDMEAAHELARVFHLGTAPVRQDYTRAFRLYNLAAAEGHPAAQFHLGMLYSTGNGIPYRAKRGIGGFSNLKRAYNVEAAEWYKKAANNGYGEAAFYLGNLYAAGSNDLRQDYKLALNWYQKADALGNIDALNNLGYLHDEGLGTRRDRAKAREFYTRAAEAGHAGAQMNLSAYYFEGLGGVRKDLAMALDWAKKSRRSGRAGSRREGHSHHENNAAQTIVFTDEINKNISNSFWHCAFSGAHSAGRKCSRGIGR